MGTTPAGQLEAVAAGVESIFGTVAFFGDAKQQRKTRFKSTLFSIWLILSYFSFFFFSFLLRFMQSI